MTDSNAHRTPHVGLYAEGVVSYPPESGQPDQPFVLRTTHSTVHAIGHVDATQPSPQPAASSVSAQPPTQA